MSQESSVINAASTFDLNPPPICNIEINDVCSEICIATSSSSFDAMGLGNPNKALSEDALVDVDVENNGEIDTTISSSSLSQDEDRGDLGSRVREPVGNNPDDETDGWDFFTRCFGCFGKDDSFDSDHECTKDSDVSNIANTEESHITIFRDRDRDSSYTRDACRRKKSVFNQKKELK